DSNPEDFKDCISLRIRFLAADDFNCTGFEPPRNNNKEGDLMRFPLLAPLLCVAVLLSRPTPADAAVPLSKVIMTTVTASERDGVVYVAQDLGLFRKYGLDLSFVQVRNGPVAMSALSSGETQFHWGSVSGANLGAIAEGADLVFIAGFINRLSGMF